MESLYTINILTQSMKKKTKKKVTHNFLVLPAACSSVEAVAVEVMVVLPLPMYNIRP